MVVLETASALLGGPYAQGAPALKMVQKRYIGLHHWLGPIRSKELKEHIVSASEPRNIRRKLNVSLIWNVFQSISIVALSN